MKHALTAGIIIAFAITTAFAEMRRVGEFVLVSRSKITGENHQAIPIKPMVFHVSTDGVQVLVKLGDSDDASTYHVYYSDGIGRLNKESNTLEIVPGIQASSNKDGELRHLRLTTEEMTITTFPARSDQAVVIRAVSVDQGKATAQTPATQEQP